MKRIIDVLNASVAYLEKNRVDNAKICAEYIVSHILEIDRLKMFLNHERPLDKDERERIKTLLIKRAKDRIPLQYLLGYENFYGYNFSVNEKVLIPRSETELLVEKCIELLKDKKEPKILDIGVGSGAICITLAKEIKDSKVLGVDISKDALEVAKENKKKINVNNLKLIESNLFSNVSYKEFDLIVSNPPYISEKEAEDLMPEVIKHEPRTALFAIEEGMFFYNRIIENAMNYLKKNGILAFEAGYKQAEKIKSKMIENGYLGIEIFKDYSAIDRIVVGKN